MLGHLFKRLDRLEDQGGGGARGRPVALGTLLTLVLLSSSVSPLKLASSTSISSKYSPSSPSSSSTFHDSNPKSSSSSSSSSLQADQRWHVASSFVGGEVMLPCAVDVAGCGRIYFITWTKNVSESGGGKPSPNAAALSSSSPQASNGDGGKTWKSASGDWQRVYIYSDSMQRVLGDLAQFGPSDRVSFGPRDLNQSLYAFLSIKQLQSEDEGVYKCDVTYTTPHAHGKCPSLTHTRVVTLVKPSTPQIRVNDRPLADYRQESLESSVSTLPPLKNSKQNDMEMLRHRQIGPFEEGSTIVFECSTLGGRPMPQLRWFNGTRPLRSKISVEDGGVEVASANELDDNTMVGSSLIEDNEISGGSSQAASRKKVTATARIIATRYDLGAKFECRVLWNNSEGESTTRGAQRTKPSLSEDFSLLYDWLLLDIKVRPLSIRVASPRAPVVAGETVMLRCTVDGARPAANITWYNRSEVVQADALSSASAIASMGKGSVHSLAVPGERFTAELMTDGTYRSTSVLVFQATRHDHLADFFCKGSNEVLRNRNEVPLLQGVQLQVLYPPMVAIEPDGLIPVNESSSVQLWCTYDANPSNLTQIKWYKDGQAIDLNQWSTDKLWMGKDDRGTPILTVNDIDRNDSAQYGCRVANAFGASDSITTAKLEVAYPPVVKLEVLEPSNSIIFENVHDNSRNILRLRCVTILGNPSQLTSVHWHRNGQHFLTTTSLKQLKQQQQVLQQSATSGSTGGSVSVQTGRHFYRMGSGKHYTLVDESMPVGPFNGALFRESEGEASSPFVSYLEHSDVIAIANITRHNAGNYSCLGFNGAANSSQLSIAKPIYVKYPPGPAHLTLANNEEYVLHGARALLECRISSAGNPRAHTIVWTHNGKRIDKPNSIVLGPSSEALPSHMSDNHDLHGLVVRYRSAPMDRTLGGEYGCAALNELGEGPRGLFNLQVRSPAKLLQGLPPTLGSLANSSLSLTCRIECEPLCQVQWYHNNLTSLSPESRGVLASPIRNELRAKLRNGNELAFWIETLEHHQGASDATDPSESTRSHRASSYSHTTSKLHIFNTSTLFDHDRLSCVSVGDARIGPPVSSTVAFRREYPPNSIQVSLPQIDLLEGERYPEKPVQCSAFANPPPTYYWTFSPSPIATEMAEGATTSRTTPANYEEIDGQTIVGMGPRLMLNMSTMSGTVGEERFSYIKQLNRDQEVAKSNARIAHEQQQQSSIASTVGPSLFRASRMQSGNYTCVARNKHGVVRVTMSINVFFKPECELRRLHTARLLVQSPRNSTQRPSGHILISCQARSNPAPLQFSWFRRNASQLLEIHPSSDVDHRVIVAQDYDYEESTGLVGNQADNHERSTSLGYQSDQSMGHSPRPSAVLSVPDYASLEEYACVVTNHIGKSEPCWYREPAPGLVSQEPTNWSLLGSDDSLAMMALTTGAIVFIVIITSGVVILVCMHRHRSSSFKGFSLGSSNHLGGSGPNTATSTPHRFKLDAHHLGHHRTPHHLLDSSPEGLDDYFVDNRSKTATLTAAYRMHTSGENGTLLIGPGATLSKSYKSLVASGHHMQNTYMSAGSVYGGSSSGGGGSSAGNAGGGSGSRPFLVSYASSNVYAEPEYVQHGSSNHSGEQLTGSTTVTNDGHTANDHLLSLLQAAKGYGRRSKQEEEVNGVNEDGGVIYHNDAQDYATYEELDNISAGLFGANKKKISGKLSPSHSPPTSIPDPELQREEFDKVQSRAQDEPETIESDHESDELEHSRESLSASSNAYNPDRDFYFDVGGSARGVLPTRTNFVDNVAQRRMMPPTGNGNKFGSLVRQHSGPSTDMGVSGATLGRYQQYRQSPVSTRLYFNFNDPSTPSTGVYQSSPYNHHSNLRNDGAWLGGRRRASSPPNGRARSRLDSPSSLHPMRTFGNAPPRGPQPTSPPEYRRVYGDDH